MSTRYGPFGVWAVVLVIGLSAQGGRALSQEPKVEPPPAAKAHAAAKADRYGDALPAGAVLRLGSLRLRHPAGWSASLAFSPDGTTIYSAGEDNTIRSFDVATGRAIRTIKTSDSDWTQVVAISHDGRVLASGGRDGIRLWDAASGKEIRKLRAGGEITSLAFSPDGKELLAGGGHRNHAVRLFDVATGKETLRMLWHQREVDLLAFSPDGESLLSASNVEGKFCRTDRASGELRSTIEQDRRLNFFRVFALSSDGKTMAAGGIRYRPDEKLERPDHWIWLYDASTGKEVRTLQGHTKWLRSLAFTPDGKSLVSTAEDNTLRFWDVATGRELRKFTATEGFGGQFTFSPDGKTLAAYRSKRIVLWDVAAGKFRGGDDGHEGSVGSVAFSPDGKMLASGSFYDHTARLWNAETGEPMRVLKHVDYVRAALFLPDRKTLVTGGGDSFLRFWDIGTGKETRKLEVEGRQQVAQMALSHDGKTLAASTMGFEEPGFQYVTAWDVPTGRQTLQRKKRTDHFGFDEAASPDGKIMVAAKGRGLVLENAANGKELVTLNPPEEYRLGASAVTFSPDGKLLAARSFRPRPRDAVDFDNTYGVRIFEIATGKELQHLPTTGSWVPAAFSPDGKLLAAAGDQRIHLFDPADGKEVRVLSGLTSDPRSVTFSPDGKRLAAGLDDSTILIWDGSDLHHHKQ